MKADDCGTVCRYVIKFDSVLMHLMLVDLYSDNFFGGHYTLSRDICSSFKEE